MIEKKEYVTPKNGVRITQKGIFDLDNLYKEIYSWFGNRNFKLQEKEHSVKETDKGAEIIYSFIGDREVTEYIKFNIEVKFYMGGVEKGFVKEKKTFRGNLDINFKAFIELDYKNEWTTAIGKGTNIINNFLFRIYNNFIKKSEIKSYEDKLFDEIMEVQSLAKKRLNLM